jgi:four helix bundle protein
MSRDYRKLKVWELSHNLVKRIYMVTKKFPKSEWLGLISQMRRASVSIPANIVEGSGRKSQREYVHFLHTALSSAFELDYYIYLSEELGFLQEEIYNELESISQQVIKMLQGLIHRIENNLG